MKRHYLKNILKIIIIVSLCITVFSCRVINSNEMFKTDAKYKYSEFKPSEKEYRLQPYDKLDIKIFANEGFKLVDVSQSTAQTASAFSYLVEYDGQVKMPTLGRIQIAGKTIREAEAMLEEKYKEVKKIINDLHYKNKSQLDYINLLKMYENSELTFVKDYLINYVLPSYIDQQNIFIIKYVIKEIVRILEQKNRYKDALMYHKKYDIYIEKFRTHKKNAI